MKEARLPKANVSDMVHCNNSFFYHGHMAFGLVQVIACVRVHSLAV